MKSVGLNGQNSILIKNVLKVLSKACPALYIGDIYNIRMYAGCHGFRAFERFYMSL